MANTILYAEKWTLTAQARLSENNKWKDICNVEYTNDRVLHNPYITDATVQTTARGTAYTHQNVTLTDDSVTIDGVAILPQLIDRADLAQQTFVKQMELADRQAVLINEAIETAVYAAHAQFTDFDNTAIGGGAGNITVSSTNIDDIITAITREIREANGEAMLERNGGFIVWRPSDFQILQQFAMANGFVAADRALQNGTKQGFEYMGFTHYTSNKLAAGHVCAGVKKAIHLGIVKDTYGQVVIDSEPATADGAMSAIAVIMRADYKVKCWEKMKSVVFDVLVA
jgi:hypothetical protein